MARPGRVVTPEAVALDFELAGLPSRLLALLVDWAAQLALAVGVVAAGVVAAGATRGGRGVPTAVAVLGAFAAVWGYPVAFEVAWRGRTPGKAALGLRVVTRSGAPVRFRHAALRATVGIVDFFVTGGAAAVVSVLVTRDNQRLGDLAAGTIVVRERTGSPPPVAVRFRAPPGLEPFAATLPVAVLGPDDYHAARAVLLRAPSLPPEARARVAARVADQLVARLGVAPPSAMSAEDFLRCVAAAYQQRRQG